MTRRFTRSSNPNIKQLVEEEQCGCGNRMLPYLMKTATAPCIENIVTGSQVLTDPGFENYSTLAGRTEMSRRGFSPFPDFEYPSDNVKAFAYDGGNQIPLPWFEREAVVGIPDAPWFVSSLNPRTGTYHARTTQGNGVGDSDFLAAGASYWGCDTASFAYPAWPVQSGMIVTLSAYAMTSSTSDGQSLIVLTDFYDAAGSFLSPFPLGNTTHTLTGSYAQYSHSATAPAGSAYLVAGFQPSATIALSLLPTTHYDVDDVTLSIT